MISSENSIIILPGAGLNRNGGLLSTTAGGVVACPAVQFVRGGGI